MTKIIFIYKKIETPINCNEKDYIKDICNNFCLQIGLEYDNYDFIYENCKINEELTFKEQFKDININNKINIIVIQKNNIINKINVDKKKQKNEITLKYKIN